jgi:hypothetical protein
VLQGSKKLDIQRIAFIHNRFTVYLFLSMAQHGSVFNGPCSTTMRYLIVLRAPVAISTPKQFCNLWLAFFRRSVGARRGIYLITSETIPIYRNNSV